MDKQIIVTAGVIRKDDKILIAQRNSDSFLESNKWEFPGGKIEFLEHPKDCLVREIKEELDIKITVDRIFSTNSHIYTKGTKKYHVIILAFLADYVSGDLKNIECQDSKWVSLSELKEYVFAEADEAIIEELLKNNV